MAGNLLAKMTRPWKADEEWPPHELRDHWNDVRSYRRRYGNDRQQMIEANPNLSTSTSRVEIYTPVGMPRELCRFSASLLFSETPQVESTSHKPQLELIERVNDFGAQAVRGGVDVACEGRVGIRVIIDPIIHQTVPLLALVPEDQIIWDIRHGAFYAGGTVIIERRPDPKDKVVFRLLEKHTAGFVERALYKGDDRSLGKPVALSALPEFAGLEPVTATGLDRPTLVPWENIPGAESDLFGLGPMFDQLNEAESLLLARGRASQPVTFVDRSLLDETGRLDRVGIQITGGSRMRLPLGTGPGQLINTVDPKIQSAEHIAWLDHINQLIVTCAGYAPLTWGIQGHTASITRAVSGYAMKLAQLRTLLTRSQKEHMALQALGWGVATAIAMMSDTGEVHECLPSIQLGDGLPNDPLDGAQEVLFLKQAMAASTETLVRTVHPTWTDREVDSEVQAIMDEGQFPPGQGVAQGVGPIPRHVRSAVHGQRDAAGDGVDSGAEGVE